LVALEQAGIDGSRPITLRQVNQVIQGLGLTADDHGGAGAPTVPGRHQGIVAGVPDHRDVDNLETALQRVSPGLSTEALKNAILHFEEAVVRSMPTAPTMFAEHVGQLLTRTSKLEQERHNLAVKLQAFQDGTDGFLAPEMEQNIQDVKAKLQQLAQRIEATEHHLVNASNAKAYGSLGTSQSWAQILYWQTAGIDLDARMVDTLFAGKTVTSISALGEGAVNKVQRVQFDDMSQAAFKPLQHQVAKLRVNDWLGLSGTQPRNEVRNVAASRLDQKLGLKLLPQCGVGVVGGRHGLLAELVEGQTASRLGRQAASTTAHRHKREEVLSNPQAMRDVANLEALDALLGAVDRHEGNWMVKTDASGAYAGLVGIDNDQLLLPATLDLAQVVGPRTLGFLEAPRDRHSPHNTAFRNVGLPYVMDEATARKILDPEVRRNALFDLGGMLEPQALEDLVKRWDALAHHITHTLEPAGRVVSDWAASYGALSRQLQNNPEHSVWGRSTGLSQSAHQQMVPMTY
jgi:hypothetical protein